MKAGEEDMYFTTWRPMDDQFKETIKVVEVDPDTLEERELEVPGHRVSEDGKYYTGTEKAPASGLMKQLKKRAWFAPEIDASQMTLKQVMK